MAWHKEGGWFHRSRHHVVVRSTGRAIHHTSKAVHRLLVLGIGPSGGGELPAGRRGVASGAGSDRSRRLVGSREGALIEEGAPVRVSFDGMFLAWEGFQQRCRLSARPSSFRYGRNRSGGPAPRRGTQCPPHVLPGRPAARTYRPAIDRSGPRPDRGHKGGRWRRSISAGILSAALRPARARSISGGSGTQLSRPASSDHGRSRGLFDQLQRVHFPRYRRDISGSSRAGWSSGRPTWTSI